MATTTWTIDPSHSEIHFKVKHLMISTVTGQFDAFAGQVVTEGDNFENAQVSFTADAASINTKSADRDAHLKSPDFFDADTFPKLSFKSTAFVKTGDDEYELTGDFTIRDVTKSITLTAEAGGIGADPWGNTKAGFSLSGKINREDFGLTWNAALEAGGVMVSKDVRLLAEVQLVKQA